MSSIYQAGIILCTCCICCTLLKLLSREGKTKKIINLVIGAFLLVSFISPIKAAVNEFSKNDAESHLSENEFGTDEKYSEKVIKITTDNLISSLKTLLKSNNIEPKNIVLALKKDKDNVISISKIIIYIDKEEVSSKSKIEALTQENFSFTPKVIVQNG